MKQAIPDVPAQLKEWLDRLGHRSEVVVVNAPMPGACQGCFRAAEFHRSFATVTVVFSNGTEAWVDPVCRDGLDTYLMVAEHTPGFVWSTIALHRPLAKPVEPPTPELTPHTTSWGPRVGRDGGCAA